MKWRKKHSYFLWSAQTIRIFEMKNMRKNELNTATLKGITINFPVESTSYIDFWNRFKMYRNWQEIKRNGKRWRKWNRIRKIYKHKMLRNRQICQTICTQCTAHKHIHRHTVLYNIQKFSLALCSQFLFSRYIFSFIQFSFVFLYLP